MTTPAIDGFTVVADGAEWQYHGTLTYDNAATVFAATAALPLPRSGRIDLKGATHVDSSALAVVLAIMRRARTAGQKLTLANVPAASVTLARVYGVGELFTLEPGPQPAH